MAGNKADNKKYGNYGENLACEYLEKHGFRIVKRNYRFHKLGEIDIIGYDIQDEEYLVFIEVKCRRNNSAGHASEAVGSAKQHKISKLALCYMSENGINPGNSNIRFDVVAIDAGTIEWIKNAFPYC